jgi:hypothetical protein
MQGGYGTGHTNTGMVGKLRPMGQTYNLTEPDTETSKDKQNNTSQQGADPGRTYKFLQNRPNLPTLYYNQFLACGGSGMYGQATVSSNRDMSLNNEYGMRNPNKSHGKVREMTSSSQEGNSSDQNNTSGLKKTISKRKVENTGVHTRAFDGDSESFRRGRGEGRRRCSPPQKSKSTRYQIFRFNQKRGFSVSNAIREAKLNESAKPVYFNVMIVGEENLGKSDFLDKFLSQVIPTSIQPTHRSTTPRNK